MAEEQDIISLLPDCLLLEIISRLELSTKQVIQTISTISKRWQHLWTRLPTLVFIDQDDYLYARRIGHDYTDYFSFIDKTLTQCPIDVNLKKFKLQIDDDDNYPAKITPQHASQVNNWIHYAITRNVQEVEVRISKLYSRDEFSYEDELFFNNSCIESMKLYHSSRCCVFNPPNGAIRWDKLKCLSIDHGKLDEHSIGISRSPCLETLELNNCVLAQRFLKSLFGNFGVERLSCDLENYKRLSHHDLFDDNGFMSIKFSRCEFNPPNGAIRWDKLTFLHIYNGELDEDSIGEIISKSPCLETLELKWCSGFRRIDITSKSVKNLVLDGYGFRKPEENYYIDTLKINAPYILSLKMTGKMYLEEFMLENVSSLVKADFSYLVSRHFSYDIGRRRDDIEEDLLSGLLSSLGHVNDITLGDYNCLDALIRLKAKGFQLVRVGADGDEDRITELIDSGLKKVADDHLKWVAAAEKKKLEKLKRNKNLMQRESKTKEKVEDTGDSDYDMELMSLFD